MEVTFIFTNGLKTQTRMILDASAWGAMKNKIAPNIRELIHNMSLNEYKSQSDHRNVVKNKGILHLDAQDALLAGHKLLSNKLEAITMKLEVQEAAKLSIDGLSCNFCEQAHESGACLPTNLDYPRSK